MERRGFGLNPAAPSGEDRPNGALLPGILEDVRLAQRAEPIVEFLFIIASLVTQAMTIGSLARGKRCGMVRLPRSPNPSLHL